MSTNKIFIINFDDSFTYNIASIIYPHFNNVEVIDYNLFFQDLFFEERNSDRTVVILGPGPGHPNDYSLHFEKISKLFNRENILLIGICLGHQIILSILGYQIKKAQSQIHGERVLINYKNQSVFVQRYNSLAPKTQKRKNELLLIGDDVYIYKDYNLITYQFHPESIGTSNNELFLSEIVMFVGGILK